MCWESGHRSQKRQDIHDFLMILSSAEWTAVLYDISRAGFWGQRGTRGFQLPRAMATPGDDGVVDSRRFDSSQALDNFPGISFIQDFGFRATFIIAALAFRLHFRLTRLVFLILRHRSSRLLLLLTLLLQTQMLVKTLLLLTLLLQ